MTPTPRDSPVILKEWKQKEKQLVKTMSKLQAHIKIGKEYKCTSMTVFNWLTSGYIEPGQKGINHLDFSKKEYNTYYRKVSRHLSDYIKLLYIKKNSQFTLETISNKISDIAKIRLLPETIENILNEYKTTVGYSPLRKNGHGRYSLSERF